MNVRIAPDEPLLRTVLYQGIVRVTVTRNAVMLYERDPETPSVVLPLDTVAALEVDNLGAVT